MPTIEQLRKRCAYLTDEHAQALIEFTTEKTFTRRDSAMSFSFKRQQHKENEANPYAVDLLFKNDNGVVLERRCVTTLELMLLAECLLKK